MTLSRFPTSWLLKFPLLLKLGDRQGRLVQSSAYAFKVITAAAGIDNEDLTAHTLCQTNQFVPQIRGRAAKLKHSSYM